MLTHAPMPATHCRPSVGQANSTLLGKILCSCTSTPQAAVAVSCPVLSVYVTVTDHYSKAMSTKRADLQYAQRRCLRQWSQQLSQEMPAKTSQRRGPWGQ